MGNYSIFKITFILSLTLAVAATGFWGVQSVLAEDEHGHKGHGHDHAAMKAEVGKPAPDFTLTDLAGETHTLSDNLAEEKTVVLEWFNPECPFVKKHHKNSRSMAKTYGVAAENDVVWLAINSGGPGKPGHGLEKNQKAGKEYEIAYPILIDESGEVGKLYQAKTTPHLFVIDGKGILIYAGAIDNDPNPMKLGKTNYIKQVLGECLEGKAVSKAQTKPYGCSVKYAS